MNESSPDRARSAPQRLTNHEKSRRINRLLTALVIVSGIPFAGCHDKGHNDTDEPSNQGPVQIHVDVGLPGGFGFASFNRSAARAATGYSDCHDVYMVNRVTGLTSDAFVVDYVLPTSMERLEVTSVEETAPGRYVLTITTSQPGGTPVVRIDTGSTLLSSAGYGSSTSPIKSSIFTAAFTYLIEEEGYRSDNFITLSNDMCSLAPLITINLGDIGATIESIRSYHRAEDTHTISGTAVGITTPVTLTIATNSISDQYLPEDAKVTLNADGSFSFPRTVKSGGRYDVRVIQGGTCEIQNGSGIVANDVSNIVVDCTDSGPPHEGADFSAQINTVLFELNNDQSQTQKARAAKSVFLEAIAESGVSDFVVRIPGIVARDLVAIDQTITGFSTTVSGVLYEASSVNRTTGDEDSVPFDRITFGKLSLNGANYSADVFVDIFADNSTVSDAGFQMRAISIYDNDVLAMTGYANKYLAIEAFSLELVTPIDGWARLNRSETYDLISRVAGNPDQYSVGEVYIFPDQTIRYLRINDGAIRYDNVPGCSGDLCGSVKVEDNGMQFKVADVRLSGGVYSAIVVDIDRDGDEIPDTEDPDIDGDLIANEQDAEPLTPNFDN